MKHTPRLLLLALCLLPQLVFAQQGRPDDDPPIQVTLQPRAAPVPALKYALLPRFIDQIEGNAAVYYGKVNAEQINFFSNQEIWDNLEKWRNDSTLEELQEVEFPNIDRSIIHQLDMAARCEHCDWQIPVRQEKFYSILLPEVQQTRTFARLLATKARIHIAKGEYEQAIAEIRRGYALARHVAEGETLVNGLVGISIASIMSEQLHTLLQQPEAPNLYWALTELPDPLANLRKGVAVEMHALEMSFPDLQDLETAQYTPSQWNALLEKFWNELAELARFESGSLEITKVAAAMRGYPMAKQALIEQGMEAEVVEEMPVAQVILLYSMRTYRQLRDEVFKWFYVPYTAGEQGMRQAEQALLHAEADKREILPIASLLLPAMRSLHTAEARMSQRIALLRVLEALRLHAAAHEGQLPDTLKQISAVPVPVDPVTGKPFDYRLEGEEAHLSAEPVRGWHAEYLIRMEGE